MNLASEEISKLEMSKKVHMDMVEYENEKYFKISNYDAIQPFFMSIVSDSNHWMFISSNGGLSAGRKNSESAIFPYYTEDKITDFADITGSKSIFQIHRKNEMLIWEPFSEKLTNNYKLSRNLFKSIYGNQIVFEEVNHDLDLTFRFKWSSSNKYGFVKKSELVNNSADPCKITLLDGIQNILPFGVPSELQRSSSNLVDAYKRCELEPKSGLGIYSLSAIIVDKPEPSEALKANIVWSIGIDKPTHLLSSKQLRYFRAKQSVKAENDVRGEKGAYFIVSHIELAAGSKKDWLLLADVNQRYSQIIAIADLIQHEPNLAKQIHDDVELGTHKLINLVAGADGLQFTSDKLKDNRHFSNVLFNIMRGGIFDDGYRIEKADFVDYLTKANKDVFQKNKSFISELKSDFDLSSLKKLLDNVHDPDLIRLCIEYLPLKFSRRHGDPSRPWNSFTINTQNEIDGSKNLDYEGNWRDLFQNWEALAYSYPEFIEGMIFKFLNATTFDGYNPYRVTKDGYDWEVLEPDNPWSYIGYWGDHQIIYLQKFFEIIEKFKPGALQSYFDKSLFVYATVPYKIKSYEMILANPKDTIDFDFEQDAQVRKKREEMGSDGTLLVDGKKNIYHVNLLEKILATVLAKMSNFIPEAGIWMNTQRPEWNDANNALVGNGASMVTLYYMHRFLTFFQGLLNSSELEQIKVSAELIEFYHSVRETLEEFSPELGAPIGNQKRKAIVDRLGIAASEYRLQIYKTGFWGNQRSISLGGLQTFTQLSLDFIEHSILANQREDKLYHAYNLISIGRSEIKSSHLSEMLEGQVAVLSSGYLTSHEALEVLDALKSSALFREDQYSYILYPDRDLPGFLEKNIIPKEDVQSSELLTKLLENGNEQIIEEDLHGQFHFNGNFKNAIDLEKALNKLEGLKQQELVSKEREVLLELFEKVFNHKSFTGRSGTFFSYEGLGSIYWHMVSKLLLAVQECCVKAIAEKADPKVIGKLLDHYYEINAGIGSHKSPDLYGAFPTDPYSHSPSHRGAQQPGMTGQVKEDILARYSELGVFVFDGKLVFNPCLLQKEEFISEASQFEYVNIQHKRNTISLAENSLCFTYCQLPIVYIISDKPSIEVVFNNGTSREFESMILDEGTSQKIFKRTGEVNKIKVSVAQSILK